MDGACFSECAKQEKTGKVGEPQEILHFPQRSEQMRGGGNDSLEMSGGGKGCVCVCEGGGGVLSAGDEVEEQV